MPSGPFGESPPSEWYPPGHGDVYYSLYASGLLENLINQVREGGPRESHRCRASNKQRLRLREG